MYKEKHFSCFLYDQIDHEKEAASPDNPRNFMDSLDPLLSVLVSREAGASGYNELSGRFGCAYIDRMIRCGVLRLEDQRVFLDLSLIHI